jgi:hypothetical protein
VRCLYCEVSATYSSNDLNICFLINRFVCVDVDPDHEDNQPSDKYLLADSSISCSSPEFTFGVVWAGVSVLFYPIGIPLYYYYKLWRRRFDILALTTTSGSGSSSGSGPSVDEGSSESLLSPPPLHEVSNKTAVLSFLYESYKPQFWYWEVIECTRRLMLTAVLSVAAPGTSAQCLLGMLLAFGYISLYGYFRPYASDSNSTLAYVAQYQIYFTFFGSLIIQNNLLGAAWNTYVAVALIIINLSVVLMSLKDDNESSQAGELSMAAVLSALNTSKGGQTKNEKSDAPVHVNKGAVTSNPLQGYNDGEIFKL